MSFLDRLRGASPAPATLPVQSMVAELVRPFVNLHALNAAGLRRGQWVMSPYGIAILTGARIDGAAEVTLQKPDGCTRMELDDKDQAVPAVRVADMAALRDAYIEEIPETRHEGAEHLRSLGYISASEA